MVEDAPGGQIVEELADAGQVLLHRGLSDLLTRLLDIGSDGDGFELVQLKAALLTPIAELFNRAIHGRLRTCGD